jgi:hypothetical protein
MKHFATLTLLAVAACGKQPEASRTPAGKGPVSLPASGAPQSAMRGKEGEMKLIPIPKDKAQLARLESLGYTIHNDHMHPPGVKSCPLDKSGASLIE